MKAFKQRRIVQSFLVLSLLAVSAAAQDPLPSWNHGSVKRAIVQFVTDATRQGASTFVRRMRGSLPSTTTEPFGSSSRYIPNSPWTKRMRKGGSSWT